jgi:hypothetical protein
VYILLSRLLMNFPVLSRILSFVAIRVMAA